MIPEGRHFDLGATLALAGALLFCLAFWAAVGFGVHELFFSSAAPVCTSAASSIEYDRPSVTTWYPKGCRHG